MVGRRTFTKVEEDKREERKRERLENIPLEERLMRRRKRHNDTVTRFYYRNREKVARQKRLHYMKKKWLTNEEIIWQFLMERTNISQKDIRKNTV